jgi:hypothetical protein
MQLALTQVAPPGTMSIGEHRATINKTKFHSQLQASEHINGINAEPTDTT